MLFEQRPKLKGSLCTTQPRFIYACSIYYTTKLRPNSARAAPPRDLQPSRPPFLLLDLGLRLTCLPPTIPSIHPNVDVVVAFVVVASDFNAQMLTDRPLVILIAGSEFASKSCIYLHDLTLDEPKINTTFGAQFGTHN